MTSKRIFSKKVWQNAVGGDKKPRRLKLEENVERLYNCPVASCESESFKTKRGCRKHVYYKHGWYYFFTEKPDINIYFPELNTRHSFIRKPRRSVTSSMPTFSKSTKIAVLFRDWLHSPGGGGKSYSQCDQIVMQSFEVY